MKCVVFGHDAGHAMLSRRIQALRMLGHEVTAFTMRREEDRPRPWRNVDLGRTHDGRFAQRAHQVWRARRLIRNEPDTRDADLFWARNLDMLAVAVRARVATARQIPIVYETLDIHDLLARDGLVPAAMRGIERRWLEHVAAIVVSSPGFVREYYDQRHPDHPPTFILENTLLNDQLPPRPAPASAHACRDGVFRLGWVGHLRCRDTLALLEEVSMRMDGMVNVHCYGQPALSEIPDFHVRINAAPFLHWHGAYDADRDLAGIYAQLDAVWAGVTHQTGANASWLLPNRVYEAGYFGVPPLAIDGTETAHFLRTHNIGAVLEPPLGDALTGWLEKMHDPERLTRARAAILETPARVFARGPDELQAVLNHTVSGQSV